MLWNQPLIGIDIGSSSVKVCELDRSCRKLRQIGIELFRGAVVVDGEIKDPETVVATLSGMLRKMKILTNGRRVAIGIGGSGVLIKRALIMPDANSDLIEQASYEASQAFPYEPDDLYMRFATLGKPYPDGRVPMALVGARREVVEQYITLVRSLGLKTGIIDCTALAIANMFDHNYPVQGAMVCIVNIGASSTQVLITYNGEFMYSREIPMGGKDYNQHIVDQMGVDYENAENLKLSASVKDKPPSEQFLAAINEVNEMISSEIQTTLNFFFENEESPEGMRREGYLFLVGGSAQVLGLDATLAANLQMPVQIVNPFQRIDVKSSPYQLDYLLTHGSLYGASLGLALRKYGDDKD